jgi:hypothetical protein
MAMGLPVVRQAVDLTRILSHVCKQTYACDAYHAFCKHNLLPNAERATFLVDISVFFLAYITPIIKKWLSTYLGGVYVLKLGRAIHKQGSQGS